MKKIFSFLLIFTMLIGINSFDSFAKEPNEGNVYISFCALTQDEMTQIFAEGYTSIIAYNDASGINSSTIGENSLFFEEVTPMSTTYTVTTCVSMKKRDYDWIGYSTDHFHGTWTGVYLGGDTYDLSLSLFGLGISFPVDITGSSGNELYSLTASEVELLDEGYYSCIRLKGWSTWAKYSSKVYEYGNLINSFTYEHTYTYKGGHSSGLDLYAEVRTPSQLSDISGNGYVGTSSEIQAMTGWTTVSNPETASIFPWQ